MICAAVIGNLLGISASIRFNQAFVISIRIYTFFNWQIRINFNLIDRYNLKVLRKKTVFVRCCLCWSVLLLHTQFLCLWLLIMEFAYSFNDMIKKNFVCLEHVVWIHLFMLHAGFHHTFSGHPALGGCQREQIGGQKDDSRGNCFYTIRSSLILL